MTLLIAALAALVLSVLNFLPGVGLDAVRNIALALLALYLALRSFQIWRQGSGSTGPVQSSVATVAAAKVAEGAPASAPAAIIAPKPARPEVVQTGEALILLSLLQEKGRFLDFISEDITSFKDAQVAAASRVVHQGCAAVLRECLSLAPAHAGKEGDKITIAEAADPHAYRLLGKVAGEPPYNGVVVHRGWKTSKLALPRSTRVLDPSGENIISPVEVEIR